MSRIAYVIGGLPFGGVENWLFELLSLIRSSNIHECRIFNVSGTGIKLPEFRDAGLDVVCIGSSNAAASTHRLDTAFRLRAELKRFMPDLIHTLHFSGDYFGRLAAIGLGIPVVTNIRNIKREKKLFRRFSNKVLSFATDSYLANSHAVEQIVCKDHNRSGCPVFVLHNAIDTAKLDCPPHNLRKLYALKGRIIIGIGRYVRQKNFISLIKAIQILYTAGRDVSLILVGEGALRAEYTSIIRELNLYDRVALTGYRKDVGAFLRGADILAMPSFFEGFGNVHLEAMYCGIPGVISQHVPSLEIGRSASIVSDCSPEGIAEGLITLLDDPLKYEELAKKGQEITTEFTMTKYMAKLFSVYAEVLGNEN